MWFLNILNDTHEFAHLFIHPLVQHRNINNQKTMLSFWFKFESKVKAMVIVDEGSLYIVSLKW